MDEQTQGDFMHSVAFGKGEGFADETSEALAKRAVPAFDVAGFTVALAAQAVGAPWKHLIVSQPEVAARGPAPVVRRDACTQGAGTLGGTISHEVGDDLAGLATKGNPHPARVRLATHEAPEFVQLQHVAGFGGQKRVA